MIHHQRSRQEGVFTFASLQARALHARKPPRIAQNSYRNKNKIPTKAPGMTIVHHVIKVQMLGGNKEQVRMLYIVNGAAIALIPAKPRLAATKACGNRFTRKRQ
jgi:hypothetical protein